MDLPTPVRVRRRGPDGLLEGGHQVVRVRRRQGGLRGGLGGQHALEAFERAVRTIPDVLECHLMAGSADYLLKVLAEDTDDFARIHRQHLARLPGVAQMQSSFALRIVQQTTALPL